MTVKTINSKVFDNAVINISKDDIILILKEDVIAKITGVELPEIVLPSSVKTPTHLD